MVKVSIILPVYNVEEYLERCINTIINQTLKDFEAIFVVDGSPDNSEAIINEYSKRDSRIKVYSKANTGSGYSRNFGLDKSVGEYIYFMDPDDWIELDLLEKIYNEAQKYKPEMIMFGYWNENALNGSSKSYFNSKKKLYNSSSEISKEFIDIFEENTIYTPWNKMYARAFLIKNGLRFSNQKTGQDSLFNLEVFKVLNKLLLIPECYYHYYVFRNDSAGNKYNPDSFIFGMNILDSLKDLLKKMGNSEKYFLDMQKIKLVFSEYKNINRSVNIITSKNFVSAVKKSDSSSLMKNIKFSSMKTNKSKLMYLLVKNPKLLFVLLKYRKLV